MRIHETKTSQVMMLSPNSILLPYKMGEMTNTDPTEHLLHFHGLNKCFFSNMKNLRFCIYHIEKAIHPFFLAKRHEYHLIYLLYTIHLISYKFPCNILNILWEMVPILILRITSNSSIFVLLYTYIAISTGYCSRCCYIRHISKLIVTILWFLDL